LVDELLKQSALKIIALGADLKTFDQLREYFAGARLYGSRVELLTGELLRFGFPPY